MVEGPEGVIGAGISFADSEDRWFPLVQDKYVLIIYNINARSCYD
jgi:hypothetical protein